MKDRKAFIIDIPEHIEADGRLLVVEGQGVVPFEIKRLFWVRDVVLGGRRGEHATKKTRLILVPVFGNLKVDVDDGNEVKTFVLDKPTQGLYIDEMLWRTMYDFSPDCVVEAICDRPFEAGNETIDDYAEFQRTVKEQF